MWACWVGSGQGGTGWEEEVEMAWVDEEARWLLDEAGEVEEVCGRCGGRGCEWCLLLEGRGC